MKLQFSFYRIWHGQLVSKSYPKAKQAIYSNFLMIFTSIGLRTIIDEVAAQFICQYRIVSAITAKTVSHLTDGYR